MRARTTIAACIVVAVALAVGALLVLAVLRSSLRSGVDSAARARADDVATLIRQGNLPARLAVPGEEAALVQVVDASGQVIAASANLEGEAPIAQFGPSAGGAQVRTLRGLPIGGGQAFRVVGLQLDGPSGRVTVQVASSLQPVERSVAAVRDILVLGLCGRYVLVHRWPRPPARRCDPQPSCPHLRP
jgi:hypothetical protein